ncbi:MAG: hypothetical protein ACOC71_07700 [Hyphomicrobiales bacterium]
MSPVRLAFLVSLYLALIVGGAVTGHWLMDLVVFDVRPSNEPEIHGMITVAMVAFILTSAVPFVPGAEIGLGLILMLGSRIVLLVYAGMVFALLLAYCIGRFIPPRAVAAMFGFLGLARARGLVGQTAALDTEARLRLMTERAPTRFVPFLLRHRYVALALAFNLPGNTLLGGGGGIALAAGMSGLFAFMPYVLTVALAVAPVPLLFLLTGIRP